MNSDGLELRVRLFSDPFLQGPQGRCSLSPYQSALLALVVAEGSVGRPRAAQILWDAPTDRRTRQRIRQLKSAIRHRAGTHLIDGHGDALRVSSHVGSDLSDMRRLLKEGRLEAAAKIASCDLVDDAFEGVRGRFKDWSEALVSDLRQQVIRAASAAWETATREPDWAKARDAAEALYLMSPDDPGFTAYVIEARGRVGRPHSAEVAYAEFLDLAPSKGDAAHVAAAIERVRKLRNDSDALPDDVHVPFVGRAQAMADLTSIFEEVRAGRFSFVLVQGEPGIGKTRLIGEVERFARMEGIRCLVARPVELERQISMNPIIDALSAIDLGPHLDAIGEPWRTVIGTMLPPGPHAQSARDLPPIEERHLSRRLFDAFSLLFQSIAHEQPTIFFLDDLQWADATTVAALQFYQRRWSESFFGIVATVRPGAVNPKDPAASYLKPGDELHVRRVELTELSDEEAVTLVESLGDQKMGRSEVDKLCALSGRHPLYLTELTRDYLSGRLVLPESQAAAFTIPISLKQILNARTEGLPDVSIAALNLLAVGSKPLRLRDMGQLLQLTLDETVDALDALRRCRLVEMDRDRAWIAHELFRTAIYRGLSEARRALLHHRLAEHIQASGGDEVASELATHYDRAGRSQLSARHGWIAGGRALERGAVAEAAHFYELVTRNEPDRTRRAQATGRLAWSFHLNRDMSRANPAAELAATRLRAVGLDEEARRMDIQRVEGLAEAGNTPLDELVERLEAVKKESHAAEDWEAVALALDIELQLMHLAERFDAVRDLNPQFRQVISKGFSSASAIANRGLAMALMLEDSVAALTVARRAVDLTVQATPNRRLTALNRLLIVLLQRGRLHLPENEPLVAEARALSERSGDLLQRFSFESNMGVAFLDAGVLDRAEWHFDRAERLLGEADMTFARINLAFNRGELSIAREEYDSAAIAFESVTEHLGLTVPQYTKQLMNAGLGLCSLQTGSIIEASRREQALVSDPPVWYYDPSIILTFRSKLLERRQEYAAAMLILEKALSNLEGRLVAAWLKAQLLLSRLSSKIRHPDATAHAKKGAEIATELQLWERRRDFAALLDD